MISCHPKLVQNNNKYQMKSKLIVCPFGVQGCNVLMTENVGKPLKKMNGYHEFLIIVCFLGSMVEVVGDMFTPLQ